MLGEAIQTEYLQFATTVAAIILIVMQIYQKNTSDRIEKKADAAVQKATETHDLVNSAKGVSLDLRVAELTRLANATQDDGDFKLLEQAKIDASAHREAMVKIDAERMARSGATA